jgi:hypothetical protein
VSRVESFVPSIGWLRAYDRALLSHDVVGGLAAGAVAQLDRELSSRGVTYWLAALNPRMLATAQLLPRWRELDEAGRVFPTALAAVRAYRARREHD